MKVLAGAIVLGMGLVALPAQALTPQEQVNLGIGLQVLGCALGANCIPRYGIPASGFGVFPHGGVVVSPGFGAFPHGGVVVSPGFGAFPYGGAVGSPGFGAFPHGGVVVSPGFGAFPYGGAVVFPGLGVVAPRRQFRTVRPQRFYDAREEIDRIYREVLGRPADLDGLRTYQSRFDEGWTLGQIRQDIANSAEARSRW
ncbi:MAG: hypothetical protein SNJ60_07310 [Pseudanabaenaceae cyanobacterium]